MSSFIRKIKTKKHKGIEYIQVEFRRFATFGKNQSKKGIEDNLRNIFYALRDSLNKAEKELEDKFLKDTIDERN